MLYFMGWHGNRITNSLASLWHFNSLSKRGLKKENSPRIYTYWERQKEKNDLPSDITHLKYYIHTGVQQCVTFDQTLTLNRFKRHS